MTLITIKAPDSGPVAKRRGDLIIPGTEVAFGGFSTLVGHKSTSDSKGRSANDLDVYLLGMTESGLQLARVGINDISDWDSYSFWDPEKQKFTKDSPNLKVKDPSKIYLPGTYSSGSVFFSPYFQTFIMVYFNKMTDSTFYIRYLDLQAPLREDGTWVKDGKDGQGIKAEDVEALVFYKWSGEETLYKSAPGQLYVTKSDLDTFLTYHVHYIGPGGFNYAGFAHPEYFNRQYFAAVCAHFQTRNANQDIRLTCQKSLYPSGTSAKDRRNQWYGEKVVPEDQAGGDGKHLMLSWTSQKGSSLTCPPTQPHTLLS